MHEWHDVAFGISDEFLGREEALGVIRDVIALYALHRDTLRAGARP